MWYNFNSNYKFDFLDSRLSHYLTSHGRIRPYQWLNDDNNLDIPGDEHLQGDGTHYHGENMLGDGVQQHVMDAEGRFNYSYVNH